MLLSSLATTGTTTSTRVPALLNKYPDQLLQTIYSSKTLGTPGRLSSSAYFFLRRFVGYQHKHGRCYLVLLQPLL